MEFSWGRSPRFTHRCETDSSGPRAPSTDRSGLASRAELRYSRSRDSAQFLLRFRACFAGSGGRCSRRALPSGRLLENPGSRWCCRGRRPLRPGGPDGLGGRRGVVALDVAVEVAHDARQRRAAAGGGGAGAGGGFDNRSRSRTRSMAFSAASSVVRRRRRPATRCRSRRSLRRTGRCSRAFRRRSCRSRSLSAAAARQRSRASCRLRALDLARTSATSSASRVRSRRSSASRRAPYSSLPRRRLGVQRDAARVAAVRASAGLAFAGRVRRLPPGAP